MFTFRYSEEKLIWAEANYFSVAIKGGYNYSENYEFSYIDDQVLIKKKFIDNSGFSETTYNTIYIDEKENLIRGTDLEIFYDNIGNMIKVVDKGNVSEIVYDNKNGAFLNVKTPAWALYYIMGLGDFYKINNPISVKSSITNLNVETKIQRSFKYNQDGFPFSFSEVVMNSDETITTNEYHIEYLRLYID